MADEQASCLLFVYGSLKRGRANHHELKGAAYVRDARTSQHFALRVVAGYPALVPGSLSIFGELYRIAISALPSLDEFEGSSYVRAEIELVDGERALTYLSRVPGAGEPHPGTEWPTARS